MVESPVHDPVDLPGAVLFQRGVVNATSLAMSTFRPGKVLVFLSVDYPVFS